MGEKLGWVSELGEGGSGKMAFCIKDSPSFSVGFGQERGESELSLRAIPEKP